MQNNSKIIFLQNGASKPVIRTLDSYANIDYTFDESLVPDGIFREVYDYIKDTSGVPEQFIFTGVLAMFCGIVGTRIYLKRRVWKIMPHDYFILMACSGARKTTTLDKMGNIIEDLEEKIRNKDEHYYNLFLYPELYPPTAMLRELLELMREESKTELHARTVAKEKGKPEPPPKVVQRSGVAIIDRISELFVIRSDFKAVHVSTLIKLWDGSPTSFATSLRTGGTRWFEDTALTVLSADIPEVFVGRLPKAYLDLILSRFQIINAKGGLKTRKSLGRLIWEYQEYRDEIEKRYSDILEKLKQFYQFVSGLSQSQAPVLVSDEAKTLHKQSVRMWHEERTDLDETTEGYMSEITARYMTRVEVRNVRYALLFSILECFDQHGQSANAITMTGTAMQKAIEVCELYKKHSLHFLVKAKEIRPNLFRWRR
jgi:hypothetical protein